MAEHAKLLESVLRTASAIAHVSILTLGTQPWLAKSAASYIPSLDMTQLFYELNITTFFAQDDATRCPGALERGLAGDWSAWVSLKRSAMDRCLGDWREKGVLDNEVGDGQFRTSVTSIGDGDFERDALRLLLMEKDSSASEVERNNRPLCNTVKLIDVPSARDVRQQLYHLPALLRHMAVCDADFDLCVNKPDELVAHRYAIEI